MPTSLIDELQIYASNHENPVSGLLLKALVVSSKLELKDVPDWIDRELSGYNDPQTLPEYRRVPGRVMAKSIQSWVPVQFPDNEFQEMARSCGRIATN